MARNVATVRRFQKDYGTCLRFNGTSDYVSVATPSNVINNFTYAAWACINAVPSGSDARVVTNGNNAANGICLKISSSTPALIFAEYLGVANVLSGSRIQPGVWTHIAVVRNSGTSQVYVNGVASGSTSGSTPIAPTGYMVAATSLNAAGTNFNGGFAGRIDDVRIYERALSASEISDLFSGIEPLTLNLKLLWNFDEGSGTTTADSSGNSNTGNITGATFNTSVLAKLRTASSGRVLNSGRVLA